MRCYRKLPLASGCRLNEVLTSGFGIFGFTSGCSLGEMDGLSSVFLRRSSMEEFELPGLLLPATNFRPADNSASSVFLRVKKIFFRNFHEKKVLSCVN